MSAEKCFGELNEVSCLRTQGLRADPSVNIALFQRLELPHDLEEQEVAEKTPDVLWLFGDLSSSALLNKAFMTYQELPFSQPEDPQSDLGMLLDPHKTSHIWRFGVVCSKESHEGSKQ